MDNDAWLSILLASVSKSSELASACVNSDDWRIASTNAFALVCFSGTLSRLKINLFFGEGGGVALVFRDFLSL